MSVVTADDVEKAREVLLISAGDVVTPLARDRAKELGIRIERSASGPRPGSGNGAAAGPRPVAGNGVAPGGGNGAGPRAGNGAGFRPVPATMKPAAIGRNGTSPSPAPRETVAGLPLVAARPQRRDGRIDETRSGALYRRGAYGPSGRRDIVSADSGITRGVRRPTIAVVGAGHVGAATGIRLAESDLFERVTLIDVVDGLAAGLALDMTHSAALRGFTTRVNGSADLGDVAGADIVVITAGRARRPDMTRTDLTAANAEIVRAVALAIRDRAPGAVVVVVTNPVEEMTHLANLVTGFPAGRVIGMGGVLDTARFGALVGLTGVVKPADVRAIVIGSHGPEMLVPLSQAFANGKALETLIDAKILEDIVRRTRESGAEVTGLLKNGSAYLSPGSAIFRQVEAIVRGTNDVVPACVASGGAYGIADVRIGLPVRLGMEGVREIVELPLRPDELRALRASAEQIRARTQSLA